MGNEPTLKEKQLAWAVAWQDQGDRAALTLLCASVERFVRQKAREYCRRDPELLDELVCEYQVAVVEAAGKFDRNRPTGFVSLCWFFMQTRARTVFKHAASPATVPGKPISRGQRVPIFDDGSDEPVVQLTAPEPYAEGTPSASALDHAVDAAGLNARERRVLQRYKTDETQEHLAELWGCTNENVSMLEVKARKKVLRVLRARGLSLEDLL